MTQVLTKRQGKALRKLSGIAYERELSAALTKLKDSFEEWRNGTIDVWQLNERVHRYHQDDARELWKKYHYIDASETVSLAVLNELIREEEIPADLRGFVNSRVETHRQLREWSTSADEDEDE